MRKIFFTILSGFALISVIADSNTTNTTEDSTKLYNQGQNLFNQKKYKEAETDFLRALKIEKRQNKINNKRITHLYYALGNSALYQKNWDTAVKRYQSAWIYAQKYSADLDLMIELSGRTALCYQMTKEYKKGLIFALNAYKRQRKKYGDNDPKTGLCAAGVAVMFENLGRNDKAIEYFNRAYKIFDKYSKEDPYPAARVKKYLEKLKNKTSGYK